MTIRSARPRRVGAMQAGVEQAGQLGRFDALRRGRVDQVVDAPLQGRQLRAGETGRRRG